MNLEKFVAVSGLPGIHKIIADRNNGLIVEDLDSGKRSFVPARSYQFTPLGTIGIYTDDGETTELANVFRSMLEKINELPPPGSDAKPEALQAYFAVILPNYDRDKVRTGDMKKAIKWFVFLNDKQLLSLEDNPSINQEEE
ncbi:MAG: DUF5606 domain-containing protein [Saprospiraceae bacterium]|nr:DUF5606 domain-containing protein [Saprospiraceae bacterium]MDZ4706404.1 DUF5606 domain-containing protein [Saprospiraceae bacterium]